MTEQEWLSGHNAQSMLDLVTGHGNAEGLPALTTGVVLSDRKLRLFAVACNRMFWEKMTDQRSRNAILAAERHADGLATDDELRDAFWRAGRAFQDQVYVEKGCEIRPEFPSDCACGPSGAYAADDAIHPLDTQEELRLKADILRDIAGNPFRPVKDVRVCHGRIPEILPLALAAYEERDPTSGRLDLVRLAILADALEEAGCNDDAVLFHLRGVFGCDRCEGGMVVYDPPGSLNRMPCPKCGGKGLVEHPPHYRGCHVLDCILGKE